MCDISVLSRVADQVSRQWSRRVPWIDRSELVQECWAAMLPALESYRPEAGDLGGYVSRCAYRACKRLVASTAAPASAAHRESWRSQVARRASDEALLCHQAEQASAQDQLEAEERRLALAALVAELLAQSRNSEAVTAILLAGEHPAEVAERMGLKQANIERAASTAREQIMAVAMKRRLVEVL